MKQIITVQHTQSVHHTNGMVGSWTDWDLSEEGVRQAQRIAARLQKELAGRVVALYASDLLRARHTAQMIGDALGVKAALRFELRERNLGRCVGKSVQWLRENMEKPEKTVDDRLFADAESRRDEWQRLQPFFDEIMAGEDETVVIVSHGDLLSAFHAMFLRLPVEALNEAELWGAAGGVSMLVVNDAGKRIIRRLGDMSYVQEESV